MAERSGVFLCIERQSAGSILDNFRNALDRLNIKIREVGGVTPGSDIRAELDRQLSVSSAALLVVAREPGEGRLTSSWPRLHLDALVNHERRGLKVIPVILGNAMEETLPHEFSHVAPARFALNQSQEHWDKGVALLLDAINKLVESSDDKHGGTNFYFRELEIAGVRCFTEPQILKLTTSDSQWARWNVILGDNGTGKTTLLRAIASLSHADPEWRGTKSLIRATLQMPDGELTTSVDDLHFPVICGYGAGRGRKDASLSGTPIDPFATLFDESAALLDPQEWFLQTEFATTRENGSSQAKARLERVKAVVCGQILPDVQDLRAQSVPDGGAIVEAKIHCIWVPFKDLSFGYNVAMTWIIDLAQRMFRKYPESPDPLAEHAIVLVDEIDLHLHPRWQRQLLETLDKIFRKTQFIVTAHSPLIVQAAPNANLALLRREGDHVVIDNDVDYIRKWRVDQILASELFGEQPTHAPEVEKLFDEMIELRSKPLRTPDEESRLQEVDEEIDRLPTAANLTDIHAMEIIRKAAAGIEAKSKQ